MFANNSQQTGSPLGRTAKDLLFGDFIGEDGHSLCLLLIIQHLHHNSQGLNPIKSLCAYLFPVEKSLQASKLR